MNEKLYIDFQNELIMNNYPHIQFIHVQDNSFRGIISLTLSNLPELKLLVVEKWSFSHTSSLTLSSIF